MHHLAVQHLDNMRHALVARDARHLCELHIQAFCRRTDLMIYTIVLCLVKSAVDQSSAIPASRMCCIGHCGRRKHAMHGV